MRSKALWVVLGLVAVLGITTAASATTRSLITGNMIKPHAINSKHLVDHTIQAHDLSTGLITSLTGVAGHEVVSRTFPISPGKIVTGSVTAPKGKVVLSGGMKPADPTALTILGSYPSTDGRSWTVIVSANGAKGTAATTFTVFAVSSTAVSGWSGGSYNDFPPSHHPGPQ